MSKPVNVLFAGGGTGGHLYPALAIARAMVAANPDVEPFFIGARRGIERDVLPLAEFPFELLDLHPLYRSKPWLNWRTVAGSASSWQSISRIATTTHPRALVATGGYAAGIALGYAAWKRIHIVIQEQNSYPGLTVRRFSRRAAQIHLGFPEARRLLRLGAQTRVFESGNPIDPPPPLEKRMSHADAARKWGFEGPDVPTMLVFGGSQGAEGINSVVAKWTAGGSRRMRVIWATGPTHFARYAGLARESVRVVPYISPMSDAYSAADLALTRAGAMTTAELAAWGLPAILVPLPTAAADHQTANARAISSAGAGVMIQQSALTADLLEATVTRLFGDQKALIDMREKTLMRSRPDAAQTIAGNILSLSCFK
ncbi:MAG: UDP-N-acetylglucosamine--N-acetylmuramyl-(pentapeptide) pyrophosphoryl-undecaprenol N-acetylglucosamine transferase [Gemmatimonadaceae bacterium]